MLHSRWSRRWEDLNWNFPFPTIRVFHSWCITDNLDFWNFPPLLQNYQRNVILFATILVMTSNSASYWSVCNSVILESLINVVLILFNPGWYELEVRPKAPFQWLSLSRRWENSKLSGRQHKNDPVLRSIQSCLMNLLSDSREMTEWEPAPVDRCSFRCQGFWVAFYSYLLGVSFCSAGISFQELLVFNLTEW